MLLRIPMGVDELEDILECAGEQDTVNHMSFCHTYCTDCRSWGVLTSSCVIQRGPDPQITVAARRVFEAYRPLVQ